MPHKNWQGQHSWRPLVWFVLIFLLSWHIYQNLPCSVYRPSVEEFVLQQVTQQSYHKHNRFEHIWKWGYFANDPYLQYSFSIGQPVVYHLLCAAQGKIYNTYQGNKFRIVVALSVGLILVRTEEKNLPSILFTSLAICYSLNMRNQSQDLKIPPPCLCYWELYSDPGIVKSIFGGKLGKKNNKYFNLLLK